MIKILILEDLKSDARLVMLELKKIDFEFKTRLEKDKLGFIKALDEFKPDLILSDYSLPQFTGLDALDIVKKRYPEIPFIIVTGSVNEETAIKCMRRGAWDYVLKEHLVHLGHAVTNALRLKEERYTNKLAENQIRKLSRAVEQSPSVIAITDLKGNLEYVNPRFTELTGYNSEEAIGQNPRILKSGDQPAEIYKELWKAVSSNKEWQGEFHNRKKNGELFWEAAHISPIFDKQGKKINYIKVAEDITERKQAEQALRESEEKYRKLIKTTSEGFWLIDSKKKTIDVNNSLCNMIGYSRNEIIGKSPFDFVDNNNHKIFTEQIL